MIDGFQWWAVVNTINEPPFFMKGEVLLTSWTIISISRQVLVHKLNYLLFRWQFRIL